MKTRRVKKATILVLTALLLATTNLYAQRGRNSAGQGMGMSQQGVCERIPDLTDEQGTKIEALRVEHLKEMNAFRNNMNELRAKKHTLMTSDNSNMNEISSVIDQMTAMQNKMMKERASHQQDVRSLLTDNQKVYFDSRPMRGGRHGKGMRNDGHGRGQGYGGGYGRGSNPDCPYNK